MEGLRANVRRERRALLVCAAASLALGRGSAASAACKSTSIPPWPKGELLGRVLKVRAGDPLLSLAATCRAARDGDTIEVEPGDYVGDVSVWPQSDITIRGVGERPRLMANGRSAEGKAIMVIKGQRVRVENLEFSGARVSDRNGAGIRLENGPLAVSNCAFIDNENGILTGNMEGAEIFIEDSAFEANGNSEGSAHNIYVGRVARLEATGCYFARSRVGHLLKSRARVNAVRYCRLSGEDGTSSYELEFAEGGQATVIGNLIQQGPGSENATIVSYGAEGYRWPDNALLMAFNTVVNDRSKGGIFVRAPKGAQRVALFHNLWVGPGTFSIDSPLESVGNVNAQAKDFADAQKFDFRLRPASPIAGQAGFRGAIRNEVGVPDREYLHKASSCPLEGLTALTPLSPGAFQRVAR